MKQAEPSTHAHWDASGRAQEEEDTDMERTYGQRTLAESGKDDKRWRDRLGDEAKRMSKSFPPSWFMVVMGTSTTSAQLFKFPYDARWLHYLSYIIYGLAIFFFVLFVVLALIQCIQKPRIVRYFLEHPEKAMFLGAFAIAFASIIDSCATIINSTWGYSFTLFLWAVWMGATLVSLAIGVGLPIVQFVSSEVMDSTTSGSMLLPMIGPIVAAGAGAAIADLLPPAHARFTICVSYVVMGTGFVMSLLTLGQYFNRLLAHEIPMSSLTTTIFLPLGTMGQSNFSLLRLALQLLKLTRLSGAAFVGISEFPPEQAETMALSVYGGTIAIGLMIWGLSLFWLIIAVSMLIRMWYTSRLSFSVGWWAFTFPLGTFCASTSILAAMFNSEAFRVMGSLFAVAEIVVWLGVLFRTVYQLFQGDVVSPCHIDIEKDA